MWALPAMTILSAACSDDPADEGTSSDGRVPLQVTGNIHVGTRAHDTEWEANDAIGIFMLETGTGVVAENISNRRYETRTGGENGSFAPADKSQTVYLPIGGEKRDILAYYPHGELPADGIYKVDLSSQADQNGIDLMSTAGAVTADKTAPAVALRFVHRLVKLQLSVKADGKALTDKDLEGLTVSITGQPLTADFNVLTSELSAIAAEKRELPLSVTADGRNCEGIVLPAASTEGMRLVFDVKGKGTYRWDINSAEKSKSFEAGNRYKYSITLTGTGIEVTSTVADWNAGNGADGESGSAE